MTAVKERLVVLLADADPNDLNLIRRCLGPLSGIAPVIVVRNGDDVIACLQGERKYADRSAWPLPRVLILDQWLPALSGTEVLQWVRADRRFRDMPVVIVGDASAPSEPKVLETMKAAYCVKSLGSKELSTTLQVALCSAFRLVSENSLAPDAAWFEKEPASPMVLKSRLECDSES
jgi:CheY-like chemotaxis protein